MTATIVLSNQATREKALHWIKIAPIGTRITFKKPVRTMPQNDRMWAMLTALANQLLWHNEQYSPDDWKDYFMHVLKGGRFMPSEDGGVVPIGRSTSKLDKEEHSNLTMLMEAFAARQGIDLSYGPDT